MPSNGYALTTVFVNESGPQPASQLDVNFNNLLTPLNALGTYSNYFQDTGTVNALVVTVPSPLSVSYAAGLILQVKIGNTTTGAATLNVNGLGAQNIVYPNGNALLYGQLVAGAIAVVMYDGTNFQLLGFSPSNAAQRIFKANSTARANTTTFAADPDLVISVNPGTYLVEMCVMAAADNATNGGIKLEIYHSQFAAALGSGVFPYATAGGGGVNSAARGPFTLASLDTVLTEGPDTICFQGTAKFTANGTLSVYWAQETSSAVNSNVESGSYLGVIPLTSA